MKFENIQRIGILRANGVGDLMFALPAFEALKVKFPSAKITLFGKKWHKIFLENRPSPIDEVKVVPSCRGVNDEGPEDKKELEFFFQDMSSKKFDLGFQMHGGGRYSNPFLKKCGARFNLGFKTTDAEDLDISIHYVLAQKEIFRYLELVGKVGATPVSYLPRVNVVKQDVEEAKRLVPKTRMPIVVINPGATDERRFWKAEKFAAVADELAKKGATIVINGVDQEKYICERVQKTMSQPAINVCGELSLNGLAGLFSYSKLIVSNDTGPLHLATAIGTKAVSIFWCPNMITAGPLECTNHIPHVAWDTTCPICKKLCEPGEFCHNASFVDSITVAEVLSSALYLFVT